MVFLSIYIYHKKSNKGKSTIVPCILWVRKSTQLFLVGFCLHFRGGTPSKFNSSPLKINDWKTILSFWGPAYFQGRTVKFTRCNSCLIQFDEGILSIWIGSTTTSEIVFDMGIEVFAIS